MNEKGKNRSTRATKRAAAIQARADAWKAKVDAHFGYLPTDYGFRITQVDASSGWNTEVVYQTETTGIYVDESIEFGRVEVWLVRLLNGVLPQYPIFIKPDTVLHQFLLDKLLEIRAPHLLPELKAVKGLEEDQVEKSLKFLAKATKDYAADILSGDLSIFTTLEEQVKRGALERQQTIKIWSRGKPPQVIKVWPPDENPPEHEE